MISGDVKYYVQILGAASSEKVLLEKSLSIGSEVLGGLSIKHPHLSPEHCTLTLQSGVLSLIDHNSDLGVAVNGKKIPSNKMIIILPSDELKLGDLILKIHEFEEPAISEDHRTKILSLDELIADEKNDKVQAEQAVKEQQTQTGATLPLQVEGTSFPLAEKASLETVLEKATITTANKNENEQQASSSEIKSDKSNVNLNEREREKQLDTTSTNLPKKATSPLLKFKQGKGFSDETASDAVKQSKKNFKKTLKSTKGYYFTQFSSVSFPIRIFAFLLDLILGFRLSLYLMEIEAMQFISEVKDFVDYSFDFVLNLHPDTAIYAQTVMEISVYFVGYILLRVVGNIIFGASLGQILIGCWNEGNFALKRIFGPIRELLGFVLAPLIVFDLPALFSKKTVKEMLTMTGLECYNKVLSYVLAIVLIPASIAVSFFSPLYFERQNQEEISFSPVPQKLTIHEALSSEKTHYSNFFNFETSWGNSLYTSFLNFKTVSKDKGKVYVPRITLVPQNNDPLLIRIERRKEFFWNDHIERLIRMYPVLTNRFEAFKDLKGKNNQKSFAPEVKQIIQDSFQLNEENLVSFVLNYGPYLDPFVNFRNTIKKYFQGPVDFVEFWKNSHLEFMVVGVKTSDIVSKWKELYIIPITPEKTYVYQFSYLKGNLPKTKILLKQFISLVNIEKKTSNDMKNWKGAELTSAELLDFYSLKSTNAQDKAVMSSFIYRYYWGIGKDASASTFDLFWADYTNNLKTTVTMLSELNAKDRNVQNPNNDPLSDVGYDHLIKKLSLLREAVKNQQKSFFTTPQYP